MIRRAGRKQGRRRLALVLTDQAYNLASGLVVDHLKSVDWKARKAVFHSKADPALLSKVRTYVAVLPRIL